MIARKAPWFVLLFPAAIFLAGIASALLAEEPYLIRRNELLIVWKFLNHTFSKKGYPKRGSDALVITNDGSDGGFFEITAKGSPSLILAFGLTEEKVMPRAYHLKEILGLELEGWGGMRRPYPSPKFR